MRLSQLFRSKEQVRLLEHLITNKGRVFSQSSLAEFLDVSPTTIARVVKPLINEGVILFERYQRGMKLFCLNEENEKARLLIDFHDRLQRL
mgnify:FL=1